MKLHWLALCAALMLPSCSTTQDGIRCLAIQRRASDRDEYVLRRVGILPIEHAGWRADEAQAFQAALAAELATRWHAEVIPLRREDVAETPSQAAFRTGRIVPGAIVTLARRNNLDGLVAVTLTDRRAYPPQRLGLEVELTACDTGLSIWGASLRLDAAQERTQSTLRAWYEIVRSTQAAPESWDLYLLSPQRFAEFAAAQVAMAW